MLWSVLSYSRIDLSVLSGRSRYRFEVQLNSLDGPSSLVPVALVGPLGVVVHEPAIEVLL
jgi:hypothetical protein